MDYLSKLNENQKKAVLKTDGPLLILAGAGSGKTRVITHRIAHLIQNNSVKPWSIFAVTFTNKACEEMQKRLMNLVGPAGKSVFVKTFHSASVYILRRYGEIIGITPNFSIYDQGDQESLIKQILADMNLDAKKIKPSMIASKISEIKDKASFVDGADISKLLPDYLPFNFQEVYSEYHRKLTLNNALDFNDLLIKCVQVLKAENGPLERLQNLWTYFLVDEYQDTNHSQYLIAKYLSSASKNICVVGDDDQSIYSWRGADIKNILDFERDYPNAEVITLEDNYRSTQNILTAASSVIKNNINRKQKVLRSNKDDGEAVSWVQANNEYSEAEFVINKMISHKLRDGYKNHDFAVFYRTNAQSRVFEDRLRKENIPYRVVGGLKFYDRKEIKDIIAYLKLIANPQDSISLQRIINTPARGIGKTSFEKLFEISLSAGISIWQVIVDGLLPGKPPKGLDDFRKIISEAIIKSATVPEEIHLSEFISDVIDKCGYKKSLEEEDTIESASRIENINEFLNSVYDYELTAETPTLSQFLQDISLLTSEENPDDPENKANCVTLMTVHNAKGLEFPVVFLTGMEEETFPHRLSFDSEQGLEEERRLCYVGITRAMDKIYLTNAELRRVFNDVRMKQPSRFIFELPQDEIDVQNYNSSENSFSRNGRTAPTYYVNNFNNSDKFAEESAIDDEINNKPSENENFQPDDSKFRLKEHILHPKYGHGQIIKIEGKGDNLKLTIVFASGRKTFLEKYTPLTKLNKH